MALTDLKIFQWYQKYIVKAADLSNLQTWLRGMSEGTFEGLVGAGILSGLKTTVSSGLTINIEAGIACTPSGRIVVLGSGSTATYSSPSGNPAKSLVVLRPKLTDETLIPEPLNPSNNVYLYKKLDFDIVVINGTPAPSPVYPSIQSDDIIIHAATLASGQTTITVSDFDYGKIDRPKKHASKVAIVSGSYSVSESDEIIEVDATSASAMILPLNPESVPGKKYTVIKTDSSSNQVAVSGYQISGENPFIVDTQWQKITFYSNGKAYRSL